MSFTVTTEPRENRQLAVTIEVGQERVEKELRKAAAKVANQYKIPGFRKGKAPYHIIVQQFGLANLYGEFIDDFGQVIFREVITQEKIEPYAQSSLEDIQLEPLTYKLLVPLEPEIKLADYRAMRVEEDAPQIDEAQVEQRLEQYQDEFADWQDVERPAHFGDLLTVDVKSVIPGADGVEETIVLDEMDWDITLDEENPMEPAGFDRELLGMTAGEAKEFVLGWPADSQSIYAGKEATFNVTVKSVQAYEKPELNDDFARLVGPDYETLEELKQSIHASIEDGERSRAKSQYTNKVLDTLVEASEIDFPPVVIEDQITGMMRDLDQRIRQIGIDGLADFLRRTNQDEEQYREQLRPEATKIALRNLVLSEVIKQEEFTIDDAEIEERIKQIVGVEEEGAISESGAALADLLRQGAGRNMILSQLLTEKAVNLLQAAARGEEVPAAKAKDPAGADATKTADAETTAGESAEADTES